MLRATIATLAAGGLLALGVAAVPAASAAGPVAGDWGATAGAFRGQNGSRFDYVCPAGGSLGSLWGSGVYTDDSSVCTAATHAGVLTQAAGGSVTIEIRAGQAAYTGNTGNGVTSRSYGSWSGSFAVVAGHAGGGVAGTSMGGLGWAATVKAYRGQNGSRYVTICPAGGTVGRVWGTDAYTDDSSVCTAGVHVGVITVAAGGTVVAEVRPGQSSYAGSTHNGIASSNYGSWGGSFLVAGAKPVGTAPATPATATTPASQAVSGTVAASWSSDTRAFRGKVGSRYRFACPAGGRASVVWGSGTYTDDSSVCTAAVHAGLISFVGGGTVTVQIRAGLSSYVGSTRHGVTAKGYGAWPGAYVFVR